MIPIPEKYLGFDIETSEMAQDDKIIPITVASTVTSDGEERAWFSDLSDPMFRGMIGRAGETWDVGDRKVAPLMSKGSAKAMLDYMAEKQKQGYAIVAWNGASFDLKMIGHLADDVELAGRLALGMYDPMFQILSQKGFAIGLAAAAKGLGIEQKKTMEGKAKSDAEAAENKARRGADAGARPLLVVLSGPSGAGKTVIRDELLRTMPEIQKSTTVTTRGPRKGEVNGVDYVFVSPEKFSEMAAKGDFLEWAEVHGNKYGSSKSDVSTRLAKGQDVILIVDVKGAESIRGFFAALKPEVRGKFCFADVFIMPPSIDELKKRLVARGKDDEETIARRIENAKLEMDRAKEYKYVVLNDTMDKAWDRLRSIVVAERCLNP